MSNKEDLYDAISLNSPNDRQMLKGFIEEAVLAKNEAKKHMNTVADVRNEAKDKLKIKPKHFNKIVKVVMDQSMKELKDEYNDVETVVELLYPSMVSHG